MLGEDGLCNIHRRYGPEPLGNTCAFFPRVIARLHGSIEMSGALSCPEVARLCLDAVEPPLLVNFSPRQLLRSRDYPLTRGERRDQQCWRVTSRPLAWQVPERRCALEGGAGPRFALSWSTRCLSHPAYCPTL